MKEEVEEEGRGRIGRSRGENFRSGMYRSLLRGFATGAKEGSIDLVMLGPPGVGKVRGGYCEEEGEKFEIPIGSEGCGCVKKEEIVNVDCSIVGRREEGEEGWVSEWQRCCCFSPGFYAWGLG